jgi:hypothetical protein
MCSRITDVPRVLAAARLPSDLDAGKRRPGDPSTIKFKCLYFQSILIDNFMHLLYPQFPPQRNWTQKTAYCEKKQHIVSLDFSAHPEMEALLSKRVSALGISRSEYICNLIVRDLKTSGTTDENVNSPLKQVLRPLAT